MNRLFNTLRDIVNKPAPRDDALPGFESRIEILCRYAENAARYEDDLVKAKQDVQANIQLLEENVETMLDQGQDRDALEYVRLMVRLRPQYDLLHREVENFHLVATALILRTNVLLEHLDAAREYAKSSALNPDATEYLDQTLTKLTRYYVMLERVAGQRRKELPDRLAALTMQVIDNHKLDMELANYILARRRALNSGS